MERFLPYARLLRLPNVFTAMADIALAALASGALPDMWLRFLLLLAASALLYCSGMVWNDIFDIEQDRRERPFRPLPSGRVSRRTAVLLAVVLMAAGVGFAALADSVSGAAASFRARDSRATMLAAALAVMILFYDRWAKRWWIGPVAMGSCRSLNVLLGLSIIPGTPPLWGMYLAGVVGLYIVGVTWFARTEARTSNQSMLQAAGAVILASLALALAAPSVGLEEITTSTSPMFPFFLTAFGFWIGLPVTRAIHKPEPGRVQAAVKRLVLGLIVFDAVLATALAGTIGVALSILLLPAKYLGRWVYST